MLCRPSVGWCMTRTLKEQPRGLISKLAPGAGTMIMIRIRLGNCETIEVRYWRSPATLQAPVLHAARLVEIPYQGLLNFSPTTF